MLDMVGLIGTFGKGNAMPKRLSTDPATRATYNVAETAAKLGISRSALYELARQDKIPHLRLGGRIVFARVVIDKWLIPPEDSARDIDRRPAA